RTMLGIRGRFPRILPNIGKYGLSEEAIERFTYNTSVNRTMMGLRERIRRRILPNLFKYGLSEAIEIFT
ncbi:hypothetical protein Hamer_G019584, partial [Homarus americanus]